MSKSKGNVTDPFSLLKIYPSGLLRSYFIARINFFKDGVFTEELLRELHRVFYVNGLGNLYSRVSRMIESYQNLIVPNFKKSIHPELDSYYCLCLDTIEKFEKKMNDYQLTESC